MADQTNASTEAGNSVSELPREDLYRADFGNEIGLRDATETTRPVMAGHFARFGEWTEINSTFEGHFMERVMSGALKKTITEGRDKLRVLFQHGKDILGQQILGEIRELREDDQGGYFEVELFDGIPPLILNGLRANQYGSSHRFSIVKEEFDRRPPESEHNPKRLPERSLTEVRVREFGPVTFPAYAGATAGIRSITDEIKLPGIRDLIQMVDPEIRAAALATTEEPKPTAAITPEGESRSTRRQHDYLRTGKEAPSWQL